MKIALVHDYLKEYGGAERVLESLHDIWPEAPIYTSFVDYESLGPHAERIRKWDVRTSWANNWFMKKFHSPLRFLAPLIWESFDFRGYDVVISSSGWYICRGIITQPETVHICYLHHPPRHLYGYATAVDWQKYALVRFYAMVVNTFLRMYDYLAAQRVDHFVANSHETARRIKKFYRRESTVIYPPVNIEAGKEAGSSKIEKSSIKSQASYYLCVARLARAKHIDLAIETCQALGASLKIVGKGRDRSNLESRISNHGLIEFLGEVSDEELNEVYAGAKALICPFEDEEFGIAAVEALGHGVPVIAYRSGGLPEIVEDGKTGILFDTLSVQSLQEAIKRFDHSNNRTITSDNCLRQARRFSEERFQKEIKRFMESHRSNSL